MSRFSELYGQEPASPEEVYNAIVAAIEADQPLSLVRAGDVVASLLLGRFNAIRPHVYKFLGLPNRPPRKLMAQLHYALATADILGPMDNWGWVNLPQKLRGYLKKHKIRPRIVTRSYINNSLYAEGFLLKLLATYRVALVGRSAAKAAARCGNGAIHFNLDHSKELTITLSRMLERQHEWDLALVGASVPGRILCSMLRQAGKVAIDIGHNLDALAYPDVWSSVRSPRGYFKNRYLTKKGSVPSSNRSGNNTVVSTNLFEGTAGWSFFEGSRR